MNKLHKCMIKKVKHDVKGGLIFCGVMGVSFVICAIAAVGLFYLIKLIVGNFPKFTITNEMWDGFMIVVLIGFVICVIFSYLGSVKQWCQDR